MQTSKWHTLCVLWCSALSIGCSGEFSRSEALTVLNQSLRSTQGLLATQEVVARSASFTAGAELPDAAGEIASWWAGQHGCASVVSQGAVVEVDYGDHQPNCGYGGLAIKTVQSTDPQGLQVRHEWQEWTDGDVVVEGGAVVTWSADASSRHVRTIHSWAPVGGGEPMHVDGEHTFTSLEPDRPILGGFAMEGSRAWTRQGREWLLEMEDISFRLQDPAPQAGSFWVTKPSGQEVEIRFERISAQTIRATVAGERKSLAYHINPAGIPVEAGRGD